MDEIKQPDAPATASTADTDARHEEATSSDTLSDLQDNGVDSAASQSGTTDSSDSSSAPSPDGMPDTSAGGGTADGKDSGGPM